MEAGVVELGIKVKILKLDPKIDEKLRALLCHKPFSNCVKNRKSGLTGNLIGMKTQDDLDFYFVVHNDKTVGVYSYDEWDFYKG